MEFLGDLKQRVPAVLAAFFLAAPMGAESIKTVTVSDTVSRLDNGLSCVSYEGDDGFDAFLAQGGASSDSAVTGFLRKRLLSGAVFSLEPVTSGCSTLSVSSSRGEYLFGRNFDWTRCSAMIVRSKLAHGYASVSTVNTDFIRMEGLPFSMLPGRDQAFICLYAPLDGMNEKGLAVSVNMIEDNATINQQTDKPDLTTTTAVRLLLNKAADVDEAVALLEQYDLHASMNYMMHFALSDAGGNAVAVEYVNNKMIVTGTPVVTNYYFAGGIKHGIGTAQSHERFAVLMKIINRNPAMSVEDVRDALESVSKHHYHDGETTEWSVVYNKSTLTAQYYHRENYETGYAVRLGQSE